METIRYEFIWNDQSNEEEYLQIRQEKSTPKIVLELSRMDRQSTYHAGEEEEDKDDSEGNEGV